MERFNYPNIAAVYEEDASIIQLMEYESYGYKLDQKEEMAEQEAEVERLKQDGQRTNH
jgi:hypothetical protein